jgi:hypothetical protein
MRSTKPTAFKWRHFQGELILQCVRWYCKYEISYRDLEEMMLERGLTVDHTAPLQKRFNLQNPKFWADLNCIDQIVH